MGEFAEHTGEIRASAKAMNGVSGLVSVESGLVFWYRYLTAVAKMHFLEWPDVIG